MFSLALIKLGGLFSFGTTLTPCTLKGNSFFFLPSWWEYLPKYIDPLKNCSPALTDASGNFNFVYILDVGLAVLDILLRLAGFAAVISIIIAGAQYQFSSGDPQKAAAARKRIYNSLIGLAIALTATAIVVFVGNQIG